MFTLFLFVPADHPMVTTLQSAYQSITGHEPTLLTSGGATADTTHQVDECIEIDDLINATAIYER